MDTTRTPPTPSSLVVYVYPTISAQVVVIPIVSCIVVFPVLVLLVICALRYRARRARRLEKRTRGRLELNAAEHASGSSGCIVRNDGRPVIQCKNGKRKTIVRFKPMPELDLDTVVEERSEFDAEVNAIELMQIQKDPNHLCVINHPISFRSFRFGYGASGQPLPKTTYGSRRIPGSPIPKRANLTEELKKVSCTESSSSPEKGTSSSSLAEPLIVSAEVPVPRSKSPLATDLDSFEMRSSVPDSGQQDGDDTCEAETSSKNFCFVIPSVSVEPFLEDRLDDSISFIDKSEEQPVSFECNVSKGYQETVLFDTNNDDNGMLDRNGISAFRTQNSSLAHTLPNDIAVTRHHSLGVQVMERSSEPCGTPASVVCRQPERGYRPTELDCPLDNSVQYLSRRSGKECSVSMSKDQISVSDISVSEREGITFNGDGICTNSECEYYDSDEV